MKIWNMWSEQKMMMTSKTILLLFFCPLFTYIRSQTTIQCIFIINILSTLNIILDSDIVQSVGRLVSLVVILFRTIIYSVVYVQFHHLLSMHANVEYRNTTKGISLKHILIWAYLFMNLIPFVRVGWWKGKCRRWLR